MEKILVLSFKVSRQLTKIINTLGTERTNEHNLITDSSSTLEQYPTGVNESLGLPLTSNLKVYHREFTLSSFLVLAWSLSFAVV